MEILGMAGYKGVAFVFLTEANEMLPVSFAPLLSILRLALESSGLESETLPGLDVMKAGKKRNIIQILECITKDTEVEIE